LTHSDNSIQKFARILVDYSTKVKPGDSVGIRTTTAAEPLARALYTLVLERGGFPHVIMQFPDEDELIFNHARSDQYGFYSRFDHMAFKEFDVLIKAKAPVNTRELTQIDLDHRSMREKGMAELLSAQMRRGADGSLRWMSTIFPTPAYAMEAEMGTEAFQEFFFRACHADEATADPVAHWQKVKREQQTYIDRVQGHDRVELRGPDVDLRLSVKGRIFDNASGEYNLPDGEIYTGPVEDSVNGWVRFTYPAVRKGVLVEGVEFTFEDGKVVKATATKNQDYLLKMLGSDAGARYLGEFAIGMNYEIDRFSRNILLDEKIGGSFHIAVGSGYPETGSKNKSAIHWDMICDMRQDSEILLDGELIYKNGKFTF
jgi:aminopeptidase